MTYAARDFEVDGLRAHIAEPEARTKAGVLMLSTIRGIDAELKQMCLTLAREGMTALAWDPFSAYPVDTPHQEKLDIARHVLEDEPTREEHRQWVRYMHEELRLERVGTMGFCMGGRACLLLAATEPRIQAVAAYYPSITEPIKPPETLDPVVLARHVRCTVQLMYPKRDHVTSNETFGRLRASLEERSEPTIIQFFPEADHGFMDAVRQEQRAENIAAAKLAWPQTLAFLQAVLVP